MSGKHQLSSQLKDFKGPIVVHMSDHSGYGDVSLAVKISQFLHKKYPHALIYLKGRHQSFTRIAELIPDFLNPKINSHILAIEELEEDFFETVKLEIETSIFHNALNVNSTQTAHPKIFIGDYGSYERDPYQEPIICVSCNIGEKYPGILIEPELQQFSKLSSQKKQNARIAILQNLNDSTLKSQILGKSDADMSLFIEQNSFAYCYYNLVASYRRIIVIFATYNTKACANFFVSITDDKLQKVLPQLEEDSFKNTLILLGYTKLSFYDEKSNQPFAEHILQPNEKIKELKILFRNRFYHELALDLMRLSEFCGVAGGHSLTEAISLGLVPVPEETYPQFNIVDQIVKTYYRNTAMTQFYHKTWCKRRKTDVDLWMEAGKIIREEKENIAKIFTRMQEEANLYQVLEQRLNIALPQHGTSLAEGIQPF